MRAYLTVTAAELDPACRPDADALILDARQAREAGRRIGRQTRRSGPPLHVRLDAPVVSGLALAACAALRPAAILLPVRHGRDVARAGAALAVHEAEHALPDGATRIVALVAQAAGALDLASLPCASPRLAGIGWDAAALADELGCAPCGEAEGWSAPLAQVRALVRLAAAAAGVEAIEAACPPDRDLARHAAAARRDGFGAVVARAPEAVAAIRAVPVRPAR